MKETKNIKKKGNKKRITVVSILLTIVFTTLIILIAFATVNKESNYKPNYKFTNSLNLSADKILNANGVDRIEDEKLEQLLESAKAQIISCKDEIDQKVEHVNWEILNQIDIYYSSKFIDELGIENYPKAHYNSEKNSVEVNILAKEIITSEELEESIIHEIFHGLIQKASLNEYVGSSIIETIVEKLTKIVVGESYIMYYAEEAQILDMMYNIWGEEQTIKYILDGEKILEEIDKLTKKGYGLKAMQALDAYSSFKSYDMETAVKVFVISQEIIVNATGKKAEELSENERMSMIEKCIELMPKIEETYFRKILGLS